MNRSAFLRFLVLLVLLLIGHFATHAQSGTPATSVVRTTTGFGDPETMDPRYASANEMQVLKDQIQALTQAYSHLVEQYNEQSDQLRQLKQTVRPETARQAKERYSPAYPQMPVGRTRSWRNAGSAANYPSSL
ncbi:hypothetical protein F0P96_01955 [Hymenobacter busanensis]|uniref:Uncharacterized protein n=1 Tax=Hymenobacter busanensis TaxID=2607656 RepID=A0A7L4ZV45_9BACT|nr:hypothetical protein [Hymenobacter busanensis]KAA9339407.1 hypothetical protein F0P96_01955 [Hymenobacter busanensis]QHJ06833.1 hypothetical protein GUY19_05795 [Hymenobacter busanensis]